MGGRRSAFSDGRRSCGNKGRRGCQMGRESSSLFLRGVSPSGRDILVECMACTIGVQKYPATRSKNHLHKRAT